MLFKLHTLQIFNYQRDHINENLTELFFSKSNQISIPYLITRRTPRLQGLSVMSSAVQAAFLPEVHKVDQQLLTGVAGKARWMPPR